MYKYTLKEDGVTGAELSLAIAQDGAGRLLVEGTAVVSVNQNGSVQIRQGGAWVTVGTLQSDGQGGYQVV